jgi:hypothetical protein
LCFSSIACLALLSLILDWRSKISDMVVCTRVDCRLCASSNPSSRLCNFKRDSLNCSSSDRPYSRSCSCIASIFRL